MFPSADTIESPSLLDQRWKDIKTTIYNLACEHPKEELVLTLLKLREEYTAAPTLREITNFTGFDVAIKSIQGWKWSPKTTSRSLDVDATEIGRFGAELMVVHTLKESIRNGLLELRDNNLVETERGKVHFEALSSFNVDITGSHMDIAKKRFLQSRLTKQQRKMDPVNKIPVVKHLYWENSILMLLRAPLPFYHAMSSLSYDEQQYLLDFHSKLVAKSHQNSSGLVKVRLTKSSRPAKILTKLTPPRNNKDRRPRFVACMIAANEDDKIEFHIGLGALTMFTMFLMGFDRDHLDEKANRAENAVRAVIEHSGNWKVVESNTDVVMGEGDVITEIDIIAQSTLDRDNWLTCEVKDFSFWRGWIFGHGADSRREYYQKAVNKLPIKEEYIRQKHRIDEITSIIVTSIPEPYSQLEGVSLVYLSDLSEHLARLSGKEYTQRKQYSSTNFLTRYFERLRSDYENANSYDEPIKILKSQIEGLSEEAKSIKMEYEKLRDVFKAIRSEYDTLVVSEKLTRKRLLKDTGSHHYQIEEELSNIRYKKSKTARERTVKAALLKELQKKYGEKAVKMKEKEDEITKMESSRERLLVSRLF